MNSVGLLFGKLSSLYFVKQFFTIYDYEIQIVFQTFSGGLTKEIRQQATNCQIRTIIEENDNSSTNNLGRALEFYE